eukprot:1133646-Pelagomonas_calceolata.AAC.7
MLEQLASGTLSAQERERLQLSSNSLQKEVDLLAHDAGLIRRFAQTNSVLVDGKVYGSRCAAFCSCLACIAAWCDALCQCCPTELLASCAQGLPSNLLSAHAGLHLEDR